MYSKWELMKKYNRHFRLLLVTPFIILGVLFVVLPELYSIALCLLSCPLMFSLATLLLESCITYGLKNTCFIFFKTEKSYEITQRPKNMKDYFSGKLLNDPQSYFRMQAINLIN